MPAAMGEIGDSTEDSPMHPLETNLKELQARFFNCGLCKSCRCQTTPSGGVLCTTLPHAFRPNYKQPLREKLVEKKTNHQNCSGLFLKIGLQMGSRSGGCAAGRQISGEVAVRSRR